jgi:hypothetical protein
MGKAGRGEDQGDGASFDQWRVGSRHPTAPRGRGSRSSESRHPTTRPPVPAEDNTTTSRTQVAAESTARTQISAEGTARTQVAAEGTARTQISAEGTTRTQVAAEGSSRAPSCGGCVSAL